MQVNFRDRLTQAGVSLKSKVVVVGSVLAVGAMNACAAGLITADSIPTADIKSDLGIVVVALIGVGVVVYGIRKIMSFFH